MAAGDVMTTSLDWSEARLYISDIITLYEKDTEEAKILSQIKQLREDVNALGLGRETDAKKIIAELQSRISRTDAHATEILPHIEEVRSQIQAIEMKKAELLAGIEKMRVSKDSSAASLQSLTQQMAALKHASQTLMADHTSTVPRVKYSLSLYATISNIRWDYDNTEAISGYVAPPDGAPVRPFHIDPHTNNSKVIADYLWSKVAEASGVRLTAPGSSVSASSFFH